MHCRSNYNHTFPYLNVEHPTGSSVVNLSICWKSRGPISLQDSHSPPSQNVFKLLPSKWLAESWMEWGKGREGNLLHILHFMLHVVLVSLLSQRESGIRWVGEEVTGGRGRGLALGDLKVWGIRTAWREGKRVCWSVSDDDVVGVLWRLAGGALPWLRIPHVFYGHGLAGNRTVPSVSMVSPGAELRELLRVILRSPFSHNLPFQLPNFHSDSDAWKLDLSLQYAGNKPSNFCDAGKSFYFFLNQI